MPTTNPTLIWDGFTTQEAGMNDGIARQRLGATQSSLLINATTRGDYIAQRPGFRRVMTILDQPPGFHQHTGWFRTDDGRIFVVVVIAGRFFRVDPIAQTVLEITIPGDRNPSTLMRGWSCQGECFWLYNDGQTPVFIWDGGSARRAGKGELQPGTVITYTEGRLWYALPDGLSFRATDLVRNQDSGTAIFNYRDSILHETENDFLNEGGDFSVPGDAGEIVAMRPIAILDTSQGQGPLQVFCQRKGFSVNTPIDRTIWKSVTYPIQTTALIGVGAVGAQNTINYNGDIWFRAVDGWRSYIIARRYFRDFGNTPQSFEVSNVLAADQMDLLTFGSSATFDERSFLTVSPYYSSAGIAHRGLVAMDLAPISSIQTKGTPNYEGVWTGLDILALVQTADTIYMTVLEESGAIALWEMTKGELFDDEDGRIQWTAIPRQFFGERDAAGRPGRTLKRLETAELEYDELLGTVDFTMSWAPDSYPCFTEWAKWNECIVQCQGAPECPPALQLNSGYQPRKRLPMPPDVCMPGVKRPLRNFYSLGARIDVTGPARLLGVRFGATIQQEPPYEVNTCATAECVSIECCGIDLFTYHAKEPGFYPYSGSGSGGSGGGSGGPQPVPPTPPTPPIPPVPPPYTLPTWPAPNAYSCDGFGEYYNWTVADPFGGLERAVGVYVPDGEDPENYLMDGVEELWAAMAWAQWTAYKASQGWITTGDRLVWRDKPPTQPIYNANQVFTNPGGPWNTIVDQNWCIVIEYCLV